MNGSVVKKGNRWYVIIEQRDAETGNRKREWHSGFRTKREAEAARVEILSRLQRGAYVTPSTRTLGEYLTKEWLPSIEASVRPSTLQSYEQAVRNHLIPRLGSFRIQDLRAPHINALYAHLLTDGHSKRRGGLSPKTVRNVHVVLRKALRDAVRWSRLSVNPADSANPPKVRDAGSRDLKTWTAEELRRFLETERGLRSSVYVAFLLTATTGMRRGEVLGLRWRDCDLEAHHLSVRQTLVSVAYKLHFSTPKTKRSQRLITLDRRTTTALREHRAAQAQKRLVAGSVWQDHDLVFCRDDGSPTHPDSFSHTFERQVAASNLPRIRLHDLRHTHASLALAAGIHPKVVSERLGHANISITLDTYSHVIPSLQQEVADVVADLVFGHKR